MTTFNWLSLFGVPTIIFALYTFMYKRMSTRIKQTNAENEAIKLGIQALLRDRLQQLYRYCKQKGCASDNDRRNFNNMYTQYHALGVNGVMDDTRDKFFALPIGEDE